MSTRSASPIIPGRSGPPTRSPSAPTAATRSRSSRRARWARNPTSTRASGSARWTSSTPASCSPAASTARSRSAVRPSCSATTTTGRSFATSDLFRELADGYDASDRQSRRHPHLLRRAADDLEQGDPEARGHGRAEDPSSGRAALQDVPRGRRRQPDADRLRRGLSGLADGHGRRAGESAADDPGEEVLRGAEVHRPDRPHHRRAADHRQRPDLGLDRRTRTRRSSLPCSSEAAEKCTQDIIAKQNELAAWFERAGRDSEQGRPRRRSAKPSSSCTTAQPRPGIRPPTTSCRRSAEWPDPPVEEPLVWAEDEPVDLR